MRFSSDSNTTVIDTGEPSTKELFEGVHTAAPMKHVLVESVIT